MQTNMNQNICQMSVRYQKRVLKYAHMNIDLIIRRKLSDERV